MILLTYQTIDEKATNYRLGVKTQNGVLDVAAARAGLGIDDAPAAPDELYSRGLAALPGLRRLLERAQQSTRASNPSWWLDESQVTFGPVVPQPGKIICVGLNYRKHARESKMEIPSVPVLFSKFKNAIAAPGENIPLVSAATRYDYEAELAVVIGKRCKYVSEDQALEYVLGYCNANDVSARDLQNLTSQWLLGKTLDKFLPVGPYLITSDEAPDPQNWTVRCWLNGELRQNSNTSDMIFSSAQIVSFISQHMTLEPGDLISTGTPEGVILGRDPRIWMKAGDSMTVEVGPLGRLTNAVVQESAEKWSKGTL